MPLTPRAVSSLVVVLVAVYSLPCLGQSRPDTLFLSIEGAVERALGVSPEVAEIVAKRRFSEARYDYARANRFLTEFNVTTAHALVPGIENPNATPTDELYLDPEVRNDWGSLRMFNQFEVSVLQPIWTWGEVSKSISAAKSGIAVDEAAVDRKASEVALRTTELFYDLQLTVALERLTDEAGEIVARAKREINRLLDEGADDVDDADLFQVLITEETFNRQVTEVIEKRATATAAVSRQLFVDDSTTVAAAGPLELLAFSLDSLSYYQALAIEHRPILQQAIAGLRAQSALVEVERSHLYPKVAVGAGYRFSHAPGRFRIPNPYVSDRLRGQSARVGIGLRQNLNILQTRGKIRQAEAQLDQISSQQSAARQLVLFEVEEAYRNVVIREAAAEAQTNALRISREWLQTETINFDLDIGDTENLVRAVQTNLTLRAEQYQAIRDYNVSVVRLLSASGILLESLQSGTLVGIPNE